MKKLIFLFALVIGLMSQTIAQRASVFPLIAGDTISTSASLDTVSKIITATAGYSAIGIQVVGTRVSGTVTAKAYLYSSLDGSNYIITDSSAAFTTGTISYAFTKTTSPYVYYKVMVRNVGASTSTEALIVRVYYVLRKHDGR